jgi:hypothetical protein
VHDTRVTWRERAEAAVARYRAGETHEADQRQLTQLGNAAWAAGLAFLMDGRRGEAREWLRVAAKRYRESWEGAPTDSWGRPIAAMKSLLIAGDDAAVAARWALEAGAADAESPIGRYAGALALLVLAEDTAARAAAGTLRDREDFPPAVADALAALAVADRAGYAAAVEAVLASFEDRTDFLEDMPVADTVLVLQVLASQRGVAAEPRLSALLP